MRIERPALGMDELLQEPARGHEENSGSVLVGGAVVADAVAHGAAHFLLGGREGEEEEGGRGEMRRGS